LDITGNLLIADWGANRIRKLAYLEAADQPSLMVPNVSTNALGSGYSVVITSTGGSVTSTVASVVLQLPPIVPVFTTANDTINFNWEAVSNLTYQLQYSTNLIAPNWQNLGGAITATNGTISASDMPAGDLQRFYRVQLVQ
jgi:hypothetical protein